jgi:hypothetical protein
MKTPGAHPQARPGAARPYWKALPFRPDVIHRTVTADATLAMAARRWAAGRPDDGHLVYLRGKLAYLAMLNSGQAEKLRGLLP